MFFPKSSIPNLSMLGLPAVAALGALYVALSPRVAEPLYMPALFQPDGFPACDYHSNSLHDIKPKEVFFATYNNKLLHGWYYILPNATKTVIVHHGNAGNLTHRLGGLKLILKGGASVFIYDYQGFGLSQGTPTLQGISEDGRAAFDYLVKYENVPSEQIVNYGESLGSAVACQVSATRNSAGIILQSGFTSLSQASYEVVPFVRIYPSWLFPQPELDNVSILSKEHAPLLLLHGKKDVVIPFTHSESLYTQATDSKTLVPLPAAGHSDIPEVEPHRFHAAIAAFLARLPGVKTA